MNLNAEICQELAYMIVVEFISSISREVITYIVLGKSRRTLFFIKLQCFIFAYMNSNPCYLRAQYCYLALLRV